MTHQFSRVIIEYVSPVIPYRDLDYEAYIDAWHPDGPIGRGATEAAAVADLYWQIEFEGVS